jgi:c-di-GMP-related signal transduction protein
MEVCVARQAILDRNRNVYAYELLYRSNSAVNEFDGTEASVATTTVVANSVLVLGLENVLCGKKAFINLGRAQLVDGFSLTLPKETTVIEILETVEPDPEMLAACERLRNLGYSIALDDFAGTPAVEPLTEFASVIKIDMRTMSKADQERLVKKYRPLGKKMLAEKVETYEEFQWARDVGYDFFQGYFFARPVILRGQEIPSHKLSCLRLLREAQRPELNFNQLEKLISEDVALSYKLMRYANSAFFRRNGELHSLRQALIRIGEHGARRWITLAAIPGMASDKPCELAVLSIVRANFCESIARLARGVDPDEALLTGLFSLLDALIDRPLEEALASVELPMHISDTLLGKATESDSLSRLFRLMHVYEEGDWPQVDVCGEQLSVSGEAIGDAYVSATRSAQEILNG